MNSMDKIVRFDILGWVTILPGHAVTHIFLYILISYLKEKNFTNFNLKRASEGRISIDVSRMCKSSITFTLLGFYPLACVVYTVQYVYYVHTVCPRSLEPHFI